MDITEAQPKPIYALEITESEMGLVYEGLSNKKLTPTGDEDEETEEQRSAMVGLYILLHEKLISIACKRAFVPGPPPEWPQHMLDKLGGSDNK